MRRFCSLGFALLCWFSLLRGASDTPAALAFTEDLAARLSTALPGHAFRVVAPLDLRDDAPNGIAVAPLGSDLRRLYADVQKTPARRDELLQSYVTLLARAQKSFEAPVSKEWIYVAVRTRSEVDRLKVFHEGRPGFLFARPLSGDLMEVVVFERPGVDTLLTEHQRQALGLTEDEVFALGRAHVLARLEPVLKTLAASRPKEPQVLHASNLSSLLTLPATAWTRVRAAWGTDLVVSAPGNSCVIIGTKDTLNEARTLTQKEYKSADIPLSTSVLLVTESGWSVAPNS